MGLFFNKNTSADTAEIKTVADLKNADNELYSQIFADAKEKAESEVKAELEAEKKLINMRNSLKIYAEKLDIKNEDVLQAINGSVEFGKTLQSIVDDYIKNKQDIKDAFNETASEPAGLGNKNSDDVDEPKTFKEAIEYVAKREDISLNDAVSIAREEYKNLLNKKMEG